MEARTGTYEDGRASTEEIIDSIIRNSIRSSIPDSISILINFGTDNNHILYSTDKNNHNCRLDKYT
jgi:hypothetical protein